MAQPNSPYATERKNLQLAVLWFFIPAALLGIGVFLMSDTVPAMPQNSMVLPLFMIGAILVFTLLTFFVGIRPLLDSLKVATAVDSRKSKGAVITTGVLAALPGIIGAVAWYLFGTWWVYAIGIVITGIIVFTTLMPAVSKLFDLLEFNLQRKKDGGQTVTSKKTTYEL